MGADIHFVIERNDPTDEFGWIGIYVSDGMFSQNFCSHRDEVSSLRALRIRDYNFFSAIAGVRGDGPVPNGPPKDMSVMAKRLLKRWDLDAHSVCHMSLREFIQRKLTSEGSISESVKVRLMGKDPVEEWFGECGEEDDLTLDDNTRVVIWFDN